MDDKAATQAQAKAGAKEEPCDQVRRVQFRGGLSPGQRPKRTQEACDAIRKAADFIAEIAEALTSIRRPNPGLGEPPGKFPPEFERC